MPPTSAAPAGAAPILPEPGPSPAYAFGPPAQSSSADELSADWLVQPRALPPQGGWQRAVWRASGGRVRPQPSTKERRRAELTARARRPHYGPASVISTCSGKGGVGKTTVGLGAAEAAARVRADRVLMADANPDAGSLAHRCRRENRATIADLLANLDRIERISDVRSYISEQPSRLDILATPLDPRARTALGAAEYRRALELLSVYYHVLLVDTGTALLSSATAYFLGKAADQLLLVTSASVDGGRIASFTLDHVAELRGTEWVREHVLFVANGVRDDDLVDVALLERHFAPRVRATCRIAWDRHLAAGAEFEWEALDERTRDCYLELAAEIADGFASRPIL